MRRPFDPATASPELRDAIAAHRATWLARMRSTERADRPTAEAAIAELYDRARLPRPTFVWRDSPVEAAATFRFATYGARVTLVDRQIRLDPRWARAVAAHLGDTPDYEMRGPRAHQPFRDALGLRPASATLREVIDGVIRNPLAPWATELGQGAPEVRDAAALGQLGFGDDWKPIARILGEEYAGVLMQEAIRTVFREAANNRTTLGPWTLGQVDELHPYLAAARDVLGLRLSRHRLAHLDLFLAVASSAGPWFALRDRVIVSERPLVFDTDPHGRPHSGSGPALAWGDGTAFHAWRGVRVPARAIRDPGSITVEQIYREQNTEVRRVLAERFGPERLIRAPGTVLVHEDETGRLWRRVLVEPRRWVSMGDSIVMVEVRNATLEPDGSRKTYFLRVPPGFRTAREAVAWTFDMRPEDYRPVIET